MSNFFSNCTRHSRLEPFFLNCTDTTDQCELVQDIETIIVILRWMNFFIPITFFVVSLYLNTYFLSILLLEFGRMNDATRKQYVFVLSRCVSSLSAATAMLILRVLSYVAPQFSIYVFFFIVGDVSFYTLLGSFVGSGVLLYLAAVRPVVYSLRISVRSVYLFAAGNWMFSILLAVTTALFQAAEISAGPFQCDIQHCQPVLNIVMFVIITASFVIPIFTLSFVLVTLHFYRTRAESIGTFSSDSNRSARTRLKWTLLTFTIISLSEAIPSLYLVGVKADNSIATCFNFYRADHLIVPAVMTSLQTLTWSIALVVDPITGLLFDARIRRVWMRHVSRLPSLAKWYPTFIEN